MIFITLGTLPKPFPRMMELVEFLIKNLPTKQKMIIQSGNTTLRIHSKRIRVVPVMSFSLIQKYMSQADLIICHGGPATIFQVLSHHKVPYVLPRLSKFGEHVNDHQLHFCVYMEKKKRVKIISSPEQLLSEFQKQTTVHFFEKKITLEKINLKLSRLVEQMNYEH